MFELYDMRAKKRKKGGIARTVSVHESPNRTWTGRGAYALAVESRIRPKWGFGLIPGTL